MVHVVVRRPRVPVVHRAALALLPTRSAEVLPGHPATTHPERGRSDSVQAGTDTPSAKADDRLSKSKQSAPENIVACTRGKMPSWASCLSQQRARFVRQQTALPRPSAAGACLSACPACALLTGTGSPWSPESAAWLSLLAVPAWRPSRPAAAAPFLPADSPRGPAPAPLLRARAPPPPCGPAQGGRAGVHEKPRLAPSSHGQL